MTSPPRSADTPAKKEPKRLALRQQANRNVEQYEGLNVSTILLLLAVCRASALFERYQKTELASSRLSPIEFNALTVLNEVDEPITMGDLGSMMAVRPTNLSGVVNRLQLRKMVKQEFAVDDRRARLISLTKSGKSFMDRFLPMYWHRLDAALADVPPDDLESLVHAMKPLISALNKHLNK